MDGEVVVSRFQAPYEAELAASYLREHGLVARVDNDVLQGMNPLWGIALGGVRVYVQEADAEHAKDLLARLDRPAPEASEPEEAPDRTREFDGAARRALAAAVIGTFVLPVVAHLYSVVIALPLEPARLSSRGRRFRLIALAVDALVFGLVLFLLLRRR